MAALVRGPGVGDHKTIITKIYFLLSSDPSSSAEPVFNKIFLFMMAFI